MSTNEISTSSLKKMFGVVAEKNGFVKVGGGWKIRESINGSFHVYLQLTKARWGNEFYPWLKFYVDGLFGRVHDFEKSVPSFLPASFRSEQQLFRRAFDCNSGLGLEERVKEFEDFFSSAVLPYIGCCKIATGLRKLHDAEVIHVTPPVQKELERRGMW